MTYFYDFFAREYRDGHRGRLLPDPAAMMQCIEPEDVRICRTALKNLFAGCREGRNAEDLKRLLGRYREYISCCHEGNAKNRYNAFVYRYMVEAHVGIRAIAAKLRVDQSTVMYYVGKCIDEMLMLCMGIPAAGRTPKDREGIVRMLVDGSRLFCAMDADIIPHLFRGKRELAAVERSRQATQGIMEQLAEAVSAYSEYCNDGQTRIDTDIRKAEILHKCLAGIPPAAIAEEYGVNESMVYADIRENEKRLAAMIFIQEGGAAYGSKNKG